MTRSNGSGPDRTIRAVARDVAEIYAWLDHLTGQAAQPPAPCRRCGQCCDFEGFGHRLFVTTPEWVYFRDGLASQPVRPMPAGRCPYREEGLCAVHAIRFCGCRIFGCGIDPQVQSEWTESALARLKNVCTRHALPYRYVDLGTALNGQLAGIGL